MNKILRHIVSPFGRVPTSVYGIISIFWVLVILVIWSFTPELIPGPVKVIQALGVYLQDSEFYRDLVTSIILTIKAMLFSIFFAGILSYLYPIPLFKNLISFLVKARYLPLLGFLFALMLIFKTGDSVKTTVLMFGIIPFFTLSLVSVITKIDQKEFDLCQTLKYNRWETLYELVIFGRMDATIEAIRANFAIAWMMITMVESLSMSGGGIGVELFRKGKYAQLDSMFAIEFVIFGLGILFDYTLKNLRYILFPHVKLSEIK